MTSHEHTHPGLPILLLSFIIHPVASVRSIATPPLPSPFLPQYFLCPWGCPSLVLSVQELQNCFQMPHFLLGQRKHTWLLVYVETRQIKVSYSQKSSAYFKWYLSASLSDSLLQLTHYKPPASQIPENWNCLPSHKTLQSIWRTSSESSCRLFQASPFKYISDFQNYVFLKKLIPSLQEPSSEKCKAISLAQTLTVTMPLSLQ